MSPMSILKASLAHWHAEEAEASAVLEMYLNNVVGVPSHPDLMKDFNSYVCRLSSARENIQTVESFISQVEMQLAPKRTPPAQPGSTP